MAPKNEEKVEQAKITMATMLKDGHIVPGAYYVIVTAAPFYHGKLTMANDQYYALEDAVWVADTGKASEFYRDPSKATEVEEIGPILIERTSVISITQVRPGPLKKRQ
jgi:hypothetical protein